MIYIISNKSRPSNYQPPLPMVDNPKAKEGLTKVPLFQPNQPAVLSLQ